MSSHRATASKRSGGRLEAHGQCIDARSISGAHLLLADVAASPISLSHAGVARSTGNSAGGLTSGGFAASKPARIGMLRVDQIARGARFDDASAYITTTRSQNDITSGRSLADEDETRADAFRSAHRARPAPASRRVHRVRSSARRRSADAGLMKPSSRSSRVAPCRPIVHADKSRRRVQDCGYARTLERRNDFCRVLHDGRASGSCSANASRICCSTVMTGLSEYFGSCSTMPICEPHKRRRYSVGMVSMSWPSSAAVWPCNAPAGGNKPSSARPVSDFPEPDSPTMPSRSPCFNVNDKAPHRLSACRRARERQCADRRFHTAVRPASSLRMSISVTRIEDVAQSVAEQVEREARRAGSRNRAASRPTTNRAARCGRKRP